MGTRNSKNIQTHTEKVANRKKVASNLIEKYLKRPVDVDECERQRIERDEYLNVSNVPKMIFDKNKFIKIGSTYKINPKGYNDINFNYNLCFKITQLEKIGPYANMDCFNVHITYSDDSTYVIKYVDEEFLIPGHIFIE